MHKLVVDNLPDKAIPLLPASSQPLSLPLYPMTAGYSTWPSAAQDYLQEELDINKYLILSPKRGCRNRQQRESGKIRLFHPLGPSSHPRLLAVCPGIALLTARRLENISGTGSYGAAGSLQKLLSGSNSLFYRQNTGNFCKTGSRKARFDCISNSNCSRFF